MNVAVPVRPTDPPFMASLAQMSQEPGHQWIRPWENDPEGYLHMLFHRRDAKGELCQRVMLEPERRTYNRVHSMAVSSGAAWPAINPLRKQLIINATMDRRKEDREAGRPEVTVGFYMDSHNNGMPGVIYNHTADDVLNLDKDDDLEVFKQNWVPWIECEVLSELWLDAGFHPNNQPDIPTHLAKVDNFLQDIKTRYGLHGGTEAIPWDMGAGHQDGIVNEWLPWGRPVWCLANYLKQRDPHGNLHFEAGQEVWIMNSPHIVARTGLAGTLTIPEAMQYESRNIGVGSWHPSWQHDRVVNLG